MHLLDFPKNNISIDSKGKVAGWGVTSSPDGPPSSDLVKINMKVLSPALCDKEGMAVRDSQFCAVHSIKKKTVCWVNDKLHIDKLIIKHNHGISLIISILYIT